MGFAEAVRTVVKQKYATFSGRASRSEYWWFYLFTVGLFLVLTFLGGLVGAFSSFENGISAGGVIFILIGAALFVGLLIPLIALHVRRFHDRNISGWWYLALVVLGFIPYVGFITGLAIFVVTVTKGTEGPNKFGSDPLRPEVRAEVFA